MKSIKQGAHNTKINAGIEMKITKGKSSGFKHPAPVAEHLEVYKNVKEEVCQLRDRFGTVTIKTKELSDMQEKCGSAFVTQSQHSSQHPKLGQILKAYGDCMVALSAHGLTLHSTLEQLKDGWKAWENNELKTLGKKMDDANRSLCTWQYLSENKEPQRAQEEDLKYQNLVNEVVALIHDLRIKKESSEPALCQRAIAAQVEFHRQCLAIAQNAENQIRAIGDVVPTPHNGFKMGPSVEGAQTATSVYSSPAPSSAPAAATPAGNPYGQPAQQQAYNPYAAQPAPPIPQQAYAPPPIPQQPRARALYPFNPQNPQELGFQPGDILILHNCDGPWWQAELNGRTGLIPNNYVERI